MRTLLYTLLVALVLGGICVATCPDQKAHSEAVKGMLNKAMTADLSSDMTAEDAVVAMLGSIIGRGLGGLVVDNILHVENYFVCSIGTIVYDGETRVVSVGVLNHVFTPDDKMLQMLEEVSD